MLVASTQGQFPSDPERNILHRLASLMPARLKQSLPYRAERSTFLVRDTDGYRRLREGVRGGQDKRASAYLETHAAPRLHLGCGANPLDGWLNTDYFPDNPAILHLDATTRFPLSRCKPRPDFQRAYV